MKFYHLFIFLVTSWSLAQEDKASMSVAKPAEDNSVEAEMASFELAPGYEITPFADETNGIANPIAIRWGSRGRLWVLCSKVYPQVIPTEVADDKIYILEDTDNDGRADKTIVFADKLNMPTGFAIGDGGVYVGVGQDLLFLQDHDGDDVADSRKVLLTGFGTGDTHQNINSFAWSPDGELLFCQGLHAFSRVETPWGTSKLDEHGVWRLRPRTLQLDGFRGGSGQNPWGITYGQWGEPFVKGNSQAISELLPVMVPTTNFQKPLDIGKTQIKSMIIEIVDSPVLPDDLQGNMLIAGYFARNIDRLTVATDQSGHRLESSPSLLKSTHRSFRPVDIRTGPDGALYIADWFNPIIGHYQASLRHPDRDEAHGRIWRIVATGKSGLPVVDLSELSNLALLELLKTSPLRERERIREALSGREVPELNEWAEALTEEHDLFEALSLSAWLEEINEPLLLKLLNAETPKARAFATRIVGRWHNRIDDPLALLDKSINDQEPRVRLEAVVASSHLASSDAMALATRALDHPTDRFIIAALTQTSHALKDYWWPALSSGALQFSNPGHLAFVLKQAGGNDAVTLVRGLIAENKLDPKTLSDLTEFLIQTGNPKDLRAALDTVGDRPQILRALVQDFKVRGNKPSGNLAEPIDSLIKSKNELLQKHAVQLVGLWGVKELTGTVRNLFAEHDEAILAYGQLKGVSAIEEISNFAREDVPVASRGAAVRAVCDLDLPKAGALAGQLLKSVTTEEEVKAIITPFLGHKKGLGILAVAFTNEAPSPEVTTQIKGVLGAAGKFDEALSQALQMNSSTEAVGMPEYSEAFIQALAEEVERDGNAINGEKIYKSPALSCVACHKMKDSGGVLGPELTAVGAGVPVEIMIESVLWPKRQVKEGYMATALTLKDGKAISGYVEKEDKTQIVIRDAATGATQAVATNQVATRQDSGTLMPPGLTAGLSRAELRDLIRYLTDATGN